MATQIYNNNTIVKSVIVQSNQSGQRLDQVLAASLPFYSRSQIKHWILNKKVIVNNQISVLPKKRMIGGELIAIKNLDRYNMHPNNLIIPQNIFLNIVYEDNDILVINKPSNIAVHPGSGNIDNTILNSLLYHYPDSFNISERAGIVHRLDKDTTGLMIIAKNKTAYHALYQSFKNKQVIKIYDAIVLGNFDHFFGTINKPIRRHTVRRTCMAVHPLGKPAITHYSIIEKFPMHSRVRICLGSGRTHQIRVHMAYIHHPLVGDKKYGYFSLSSISKFNLLCDYLNYFNRQALHACTLQLLHPITQAKMQWHAPLPDDILKLINILRQYNLTE